MELEQSSNPSSGSLQVADQQGVPPIPPSPVQTSTPDNANDGPSDTAKLPPLTMQIVVRRDLLETWGVGPLIAQGAHASTAVLHETRHLPNTIAYLDDVPNMRKVVLECPNASNLQKLASLLSSTSPESVPFHLWVEQPENVPTCLALSPNRRDPRVKKCLDKAGCRLWKS